ncbi:putative late blight resistance protein homolog R1B-16 isoform X1 [Salvia hispanica]|uniref:putative late blight resistance protein homolog R1B-16 isoform X1 n=1 Tax=Salvia hispanica TaxID=49212 RepID=UPI002009C876|nr:putative late blight resistance protein homolog R1B-16 isoform X1 [Salvia hispanica]
MNTVDYIQNHPQPSTSLDHSSIQLLRGNICFFLDFIETYSSHGHGGINETVDDLVNQIAAAAHVAEDAFESHAISQFRDGGDSLDLHKVIVAMDLLRDKTLKVKEERGLKHHQPTPNSSKPPISGETIMVGFDDNLTQLLDVLTGNESSRQIISIVGMAGIGLLSHLKELTSNIELVANERDEYRLGEQLYKTLVGRRYLVVLDDMWSVEVWDKIKFYFPDDGNGSRLVFTTRFSDLAVYCSSVCVEMNLLNEYECWELLCVRVFGHEDCPVELELIGREIAAMCKGLPLSVTVIGGLLQKSAKTVEYWQDVLVNIRSVLSSGEGDHCLNVLYSGYTHLPAHLKPCFLYMGTFKEDSEIQVSQLTRLLVAEGFLKPEGNRVLEEVAEDYLKNLVDRNLVVVGKLHKNGKIRSVQIHDLVRDLCISIAEKEKFCPDGRVWFTSKDSCVEDVLQKCKLRFFAYNTLSLNSLFVLPSSISLLWNLQTLIIGGIGYCLVNAPVEIWNMSQLRHVVCNNIHLPDPPPSDGGDGFCILRNLQTLVGVVNFRWSEEACKRVPNVKKLHVRFHDSFAGYEDCLYLVYLQNLRCLHMLESLKIQFPFCILQYPMDLLSKRLSFPTCLNKLHLINCSLTRVDLATIGSLPHLQVVELEHISVLGGKWSAVAGDFPSLKCLRINSCDLVYWGVEASAFRVLERLVVEDLWQLKEIPAEMGKIYTLKLIYLHHCSESAAISAMEIKKEQESFGNDDLLIQVNISFYSSYGFLVRGKEEGLPIDVMRYRPF